MINLSIGVDGVDDQPLSDQPFYRPLYSFSCGFGDFFFFFFFFWGLFWVFGGDLWLLWVIVVFVLVVSGGFSFDWWWWQLSLGGLLPWVCRFMVVGVCRGGLGGGGSLLW